VLRAVDTLEGILFAHLAEPLEFAACGSSPAIPGRL